MTHQPHATTHNILSSVYPPFPCMGASLRLVIAHVWPRNCQPQRPGRRRPSALRLAWGFGDSSLWSAKSVAIHCDVGSVICTFVVVVSHIRCTTPFAERTNDQVLLPLLLLAATLFFFQLYDCPHSPICHIRQGIRVRAGAIKRASVFCAIVLAIFSLLPQASDN